MGTAGSGRDCNCSFIRLSSPTATTQRWAVSSGCSGSHRTPLRPWPRWCPPGQSRPSSSRSSRAQHRVPKRQPWNVSLGPIAPRSTSPTSPPASASCLCATSKTSSSITLYVARRENPRGVSFALSVQRRSDGTGRLSSRIFLEFPSRIFYMFASRFVRAPRPGLRFLHLYEHVQHSIKH